MELRRKKKRTRLGEKMMDRETMINQNDTKEYLHYILDAEEAIEINREASDVGKRRCRKSVSIIVNNIKQSKNFP
jgi:hypothetical protein